MSDERAIDARLSRIETRLDEIARAFVTLARVEERMTTLFKRMQTYESTQADIMARVGKIENSVGANRYTLRFAERLFWIVASSGVAAYLAVLVK